MNKLVNKIATGIVGIAMAIGVGVTTSKRDIKNVFAAATSYTITFSGTSSDSTQITTSTTASSITGSSAYVTGNVAAATKAYGATSSGIKLGTSSASGSIKINLSTSGQVTPTSIVVNAKLYNSSKAATLGVNGSTKQSVSSSYSDITFNYTSALTYLQIDSTKYIWVKSITVNYNSGPTKLSTPSPAYDDNYKQVTWGNVSGASYYQVKVDSGEYETGSSPYDVSTLATGIQHTIYVIAKGDGTNYSDSDPGSTTFTPTSSKALVSIALSGTYPTSFITGDLFSHAGMVVTATYDDLSSEDVSSSATWSSPDMSTAGNKTVTVSYTYLGVTKSQTYNITVEDRILTGIVLSGQSTSYAKDATFSFDGTCTASYSNAPDRVVTPTSVSSPDMSTIGTKTVTISYTENGVTKTAEYDITVNKVPKPGETVYTLDGTITGTGSSYAGENETTQSNITWIVNGNITMDPWRIGGKSISDVNRNIYSTNPISDSVAQIDMELGTSTITVNFINLIVASDSSFSNVVDTVNVDYELSKTATITPSALDVWPSNSYYKFVINVTNTTGSNQYVQFVGANFKAAAKYSAEIQGPSSVNSGVQWASTGVTDEQSDPVPNVTYSFSASGCTITSSDTAAGTFTATGLGTVTVSASAGSMYEISSKEVTVLSDDPSISPEKDTISAYKGVTESISFLYANIDEAITVVSNDTSVVTISNLSYDAGTGSVDFNYVGVGSDIDVYFKEGSTTLATVVVSVQTISITISESSASIPQGQSLVLTATASYGTVNWECDCLTSDIVVTKNVENDFEATVSVALATTVDSSATVTVYSTTDTSVKATCVVTVTKFISYIRATSMNQLWNGQKVVIGNESGTEIAKAYDGSSNNVKAYQTSTSSSEFVSQEDAASACVYILNQVVYDSNKDDVVDSVAWTLFDGTYYLYAASNTANHLKGKTAVDKDCYWNISFNEETLNITSVTNTSRGAMQYNAGSTLFSCYASTSSQAPIAFYVLDDNSDGTSSAKAFTDTYMHMESEVEGQCNTYYPIAKVAYNSLESTAKTKFSTTQVAAYERLKDWAAAHGEHIGNDLNLVKNTRFALFANALNDSGIMIAIIASAISVAAIGGYFFLRKRKEQ